MLHIISSTTLILYRDALLGYKIAVCSSLLIYIREAIVNFGATFVALIPAIVPPLLR